MGAVQDGAGAAAASSQGMGGMGGDDDGFVVPKTSAQLRPGPGEVGAPGSVSPWLPPSANESTLSPSKLLHLFLFGSWRHRPNVCAERKRTALAQVGQHRRTVACAVEPCKTRALALLLKPGFRERSA